MRWLRTELRMAPDLRSRALGPVLTAPPGELWPFGTRFAGASVMHSSFVEVQFRIFIGQHALLQEKPRTPSHSIRLLGWPLIAVPGAVQPVVPLCRGRVVVARCSGPRRAQNGPPLPWGWRQHRSERPRSKDRLDPRLCAEPPHRPLAAQRASMAALPARAAIGHAEARSRGLLSPAALAWWLTSTRLPDARSTRT